MSEENSVEALLEEARLAAAMPPPAERFRLREAAGFSRAHIAATVGVGRSTIANWETGVSDPTPPARLPYLRILKGLADIYPPPAAHGDPIAALFADAPGGPAPERTAAPATPHAAPVPAAFTGLETLRGPDGRAIEGDPGPCVRCGVETTYQSTDGRPLHSGAMCQPTTTPTPAPTATTPAPAAPAPAPVSPVPAPVPTRPQRRSKSAERAEADLMGLIRGAVEQEAERAGGDEDAALKALINRAIPDVMHLFNETRATARYEYTAYPALPDILHKPSKKEPDQIWEARPAYNNPSYSMRAPHADLRVTALDVNAAYLSALKVWLPIGKLEHTTGADGVGPKRSGVHLITPAEWAHPHLPNPLGDRDEPGALWITDATLRLLLRLSGPKWGLTGAPTVHESWTSGATENFLDALRKLLVAARSEAITAGDKLMIEYVKAMYSKFVSTMGESVHNREMVRPDWMHNIHSQAYALHCGRAYKAHQAGLDVVALKHTDELHVIGDWRQVFTEGRGVSELKIKQGDGKASGEYLVGKVGG
ncbi:helix-turn-helix domain-containing protein [Streptomyces sp. VB1]|uniref:helix-turn-helix domain-containing protein n=1 Tax=Streptomyces sp. VB1 TaxID=2986803 RepID=UPI0022429C65|nr:helix-turn-helix domain-containing protein [Streptomyces sp. VB1]UZI26660.1 helix-turn-helix domain-containing protein [Streptomyces sp. VB1]UZI33460.1 helix-turn-helix domain-containing protein [Streptomyces sp. VB1]